VFCPNCGFSTVVIHSVPGKHVRVRCRQCEGCGTRFTATERIAPLSRKVPVEVLSVKPAATVSDIRAKGPV